MELIKEQQKAPQNKVIIKIKAKLIEQKTTKNRNKKQGRRPNLKTDLIKTKHNY